MLKVNDEILHPHARALADRGRLRGLKMRIGKRGLRLIFFGKVRQRRNGAEQQPPHAQKRVTLEDNVRIIADEAARRAEMDDRPRLGAGLGKGVDMRHNVMAQLPLMPRGSLIIYIIQVRAHLVKLFVGNIEAKLLLALREGKPQPAPCGKLSVVGEYLLHFPPGIAPTQGIFIYIMHMPLHSAFRLLLHI